MQKQETVVDQFTGEIISSEITNIKFVKDTDEFIQVYLKDMSGLTGVTTHGEFKTLLWIWKFSKYIQDGDVGNTFMVSGPFFKALQEKSGIKENSARNYICSLSNKGILIKSKEFRSVYYLNPKFFFKGVLSDRTKCLTSVIQYKIGEQD